jgi:hypothetical protein
MNRRSQAITVLQATQDSPTFARLASLAQDSVERLKAIESIIPSALRHAVKAGPIDGNSWCLILENSASAAKIRQLLPAIQSHLRSRGWEVNSIRLKIQTSRST